MILWTRFRLSPEMAQPSWWDSSPLGSSSLHWSTWALRKANAFVYAVVAVRLSLHTSAGAMLFQLHGTSHADHMGMLLQVDGSPFHFAGFNNYYMPTYAADPNLNERTQDVDVVFQ